MLEWLKTILGDAYSEDIDRKVSAEIGKNFVNRADFNSLNEAKKNLDKQISERDKQLEDLKRIDADGLQKEIQRLQNENKAAAETHQAEMNALRLNAALDAAITQAKGRNTTAIKALMDVSKLKLKDDGCIDGLDLESLKQSAPYLFEIEDVKRVGAGYEPGGNPNGGGTDDPNQMSYDQYKAWRNKQ